MLPKLVSKILIDKRSCLKTKIYPIRLIWDLSGKCLLAYQYLHRVFLNTQTSSEKSLPFVRTCWEIKIRGNLLTRPESLKIASTNICRPFVIMTYQGLVNFEGPEQQSVLNSDQLRLYLAHIFLTFHHTLCLLGYLLICGKMPSFLAPLVSQSKTYYVRKLWRG